MDVINRSTGSPFDNSERNQARATIIDVVSYLQSHSDLIRTLFIQSDSLEETCEYEWANPNCTNPNCTIEVRRIKHWLENVHAPALQYSGDRRIYGERAYGWQARNGFHLPRRVVEVGGISVEPLWKAVYRRRALSPNCRFIGPILRVVFFDSRPSLFRFNSLGEL